VSHYKEDVAAATKSMIENARLLIQSSEDLIKAYQPDHPNYKMLYSAFHRLMNNSSNIDREIGELSMFL
jgi:hypothetical protein